MNAVMAASSANAQQQHFMRAAAGLPPHGPIPRFLPSPYEPKPARSPFEQPPPHLQPPPPPPLFAPQMTPTGLTLAGAQHVLEQHTQQLQLQLAQHKMRAEKLEQHERDKQKFMEKRNDHNSAVAAVSFHGAKPTPPDDESIVAKGQEDRRSQKNNKTQDASHNQQNGKQKGKDFSALSPITESPAKTTAANSLAHKRQSSSSHESPSKKPRSMESASYRSSQSNEPLMGFSPSARQEDQPGSASSTNVKPRPLNSNGAKCPLMGPFLESFEQGTFLENMDQQISRVLSGFSLYGKKLEMKPTSAFSGYPGQPLPLPTRIVGFSEQQLQEMAETMVKQQNKALTDAVRMVYLECKNRHEIVMEDEIQKKVRAALNEARLKFERALIPEAKSTAARTKVLEEKVRKSVEEKDKIKSQLDASRIREAELVSTLGQLRAEKAQAQRERESLKLEMEELKKNHARSLRAYMKASINSLRTLRRQQDDS